MFAPTKVKCKCLNIINSMCRLLFVYQINMGIYNPTKNVSPTAEMPKNSTDKNWRIFEFH